MHRADEHVATGPAMLPKPCDTPKYTHIIWPTVSKFCLVINAQREESCCYDWTWLCNWRGWASASQLFRDPNTQQYGMTWNNQILQGDHIRWRVTFTWSITSPDPSGRASCGQKYCDPTTYAHIIWLKTNADLKVKVHTLNTTSEALRYGTCFQGISQFYLQCTSTHSSAIGMSHACLWPAIYSWYSLTDPRVVEGWVGLGG